MLDTLATEIHQQSVEAGWWDDYPNKLYRHETAMMLVVSEIAEAMEGDRKGLQDDHLPEFKMFDVELADAAIRLLDLAGAYELDGFDDPEFAATVQSRGKNWHHLTVPEQLYRLCGYASNLSYGSNKSVVYDTLAGVVAIAELNEVDLFGMIDAKRAYNKQRADHKLSNRAAEGGKKY